MIGGCVIYFHLSFSSSKNAYELCGDILPSLWSTQISKKKIHCRRIFQNRWRCQWCALIQKLFNLPLGNFHHLGKKGDFCFFTSPRILISRKNVTIVNLWGIKIPKNYVVWYFSTFALFCMLLTNFVKNSRFSNFSKFNFCQFSNALHEKCWASNTQHSLFTAFFHKICCSIHIEPEIDRMSTTLKKSSITSWYTGKEWISKFTIFPGSIYDYSDINRSKIQSTHSYRYIHHFQNMGDFCFFTLSSPNFSLKIKSWRTRKISVCSSCLSIWLFADLRRFFSLQIDSRDIFLCNWYSRR